MIVWSSKKLERALARGEITAWGKVKYLILPAVMSVLFGPFYVIRPLFGERPPALNSFFSFVFAVLAAYLTYWGIKRCFRQNEQIDGKVFFERFVVLVVPPAICVIAIVVPTSVALLMLAVALREQIPFLFRRAPVLIAALGPLGTYALYSMARNSFRRFGELSMMQEPEGPNRAGR